MTIENGEQAKDAIAAVSQWLSKTERATSDSKALSGLQNLASEWAYGLLEAANCDGMGGCLLCQR